MKIHAENQHQDFPGLGVDQGLAAWTADGASLCGLVGPQRGRAVRTIRPWT